MRGITWAMAVLVGVVVISLSPKTIAAGDVAWITAEELNTKLGDPDVTIIDVRPGAHGKASDPKIPGAVRENPYTVQSWAAEYPQGKTLVLYCR